MLLNTVYLTLITEDCKHSCHVMLCEWDQTREQESREAETSRQASAQLLDRESHSTFNLVFICSLEWHLFKNLPLQIKEGGPREKISSEGLNVLQRRTGRLVEENHSLQSKVCRISEHTCPTLKQRDHSSRRPHWFHSCQLKTGSWDYNSQKLKIGK